MFIGQLIPALMAGGGGGAESPAVFFQEREETAASSTTVFAYLITHHFCTFLDNIVHRLSQVRSSQGHTSIKIVIIQLLHF